MTAAMVALTLSLGVWQVRRLAWKTALLAEIDRGEMAQPVGLAPVPGAFSRVRVEGEFLAATALYGTEVRSTRAGIAMGAHLVQPLRLADGRVALVDRGWVPADAAPPSPGPAAVTAYVRPPEYPVRFGAADDPATRRFYALDPAAIGAALGVAQPGAVHPRRPRPGPAGCVPGTCSGPTAPGQQPPGLCRDLVCLRPLRAGRLCRLCPPRPAPPRSLHDRLCSPA